MTNSKIHEGLYYYCFYRIFTKKHVNHHHVLIRCEEEFLGHINVLDTDEYQYRLISMSPKFLSEEDQADSIHRGLIMDGESLLSRFKAQQKTIQHENR